MPKVERSSDDVAVEGAHVEREILLDPELAGRAPR
jgi:hypothetical protein